MLTIGKNPISALFALPFVLQWTLIEGLIDFYFGIGVFLFALSFAIRYLKSRRRLDAILLSSISAVVFLAHIHAVIFQALAILCLGVAFLAISPKLNLSTVLKTALFSGVPILALCCIWLIWGHAPQALESTSTLQIPIEDRLYSLFYDGPIVITGGPGAKVVVLGLLAILLNAILFRVHFVFLDTQTPKDYNIFLIALSAFWFFCLSLVFFAPPNIGLYWSIHTRFIPIVWLLGVVMLAPVDAATCTPNPMISSKYTFFFANIIRLASVVLMLSVVLFSRATWRDASEKWSAFSDGLIEVLSAAPDESQGMYIVEGSGMAVDRGFRPHLWRHLGQYHTALNRGPVTFSFGWHPGRIIRETNRRTTFLEWGNPADIKRRFEFGCVDVIVQLGSTPLDTLDTLVLLKRQAHWALYRFEDPCPTLTLPSEHTNLVESK